MTEEAQLLSRLQEQDAQALETAVGRYTPYLATVLYRMAGAALSAEDTEEIVADAFVALWQCAGRIDLKKGTLRGYLAATARNLAKKRLSSRRETVPLEEAALPQVPPAELSPGPDLWDAVMALGEPDSELFVRYYKYGQSLREIAAATDLNLSTVKTKLSRGRKKLKIMLSEEGSL